MQYITAHRLTLGLWHVVGKTAAMVVSNARVVGYKH